MIPFTCSRPYRTANEPKVHSLVRKSFAFVPSAGMRLAPEVLVLELMREVFFSDFASETRAKNLDPDEMDDERRYRIATNERAVLYTLRGRRKRPRLLQHRFFLLLLTRPSLSPPGSVRARLG